MMGDFNDIRIFEISLKKRIKIYCDANRLKSFKTIIFLLPVC